MRVAAACRFSWRTAGPPGRSLTGVGRAGRQRAAASSSAASLFEMLFIVFSSQSTLNHKSVPPLAGATTRSRRAMRISCASAGRSSGRTIAPHADRPALPRHLDQRAVAGARLHAHPVAVELRALAGARAFSSSTTSRRPCRRMLLAVGRVPRIHQEGQPHRRQLEPGKRQDQRRALEPEDRADPQRHHAQRRVEPAQLGRRDRAVALQEPVDALALDSGETKYRIRHG